MNEINNRYPELTALARRFPTLDGAPIEPFDPLALDRRVLGGRLRGSFPARGLQRARGMEVGSIRGDRRVQHLGRGTPSGVRGVV
jgi:hypothetical protein